MYTRIGMKRGEEWSLIRSCVFQGKRPLIHPQGRAVPHTLLKKQFGFFFRDG